MSGRNLTLFNLICFGLKLPFSLFDKLVFTSLSPSFNALCLFRGMWNHSGALTARSQALGEAWESVSPAQLQQVSRYPGGLGRAAHLQIRSSWAESGGVRVRAGKEGGGRRFCGSVRSVSADAGVRGPAGSPGCYGPGGARGWASVSVGRRSRAPGLAGGSCRGRRGPRVAGVAGGPPVPASRGPSLSSGTERHLSLDCV